MISKNKISLFDLSMRLLPWVNNESESVGVEIDSSRTSSNLDKRLGDLSVLSLFVLVRTYKSRGLRTRWWNDETRRIGCVAAGLAGRRPRLEFKGSVSAMIDAQLVACRAESSGRRLRDRNLPLCIVRLCPTSRNIYVTCVTHCWGVGCPWSLVLVH